MESTRYSLLYMMSWLFHYTIFLVPQIIVLYMEITNNSQNQWVESSYCLVDCLNRYIPNRISPRCRRIGSINMDRPSDTKWYLEWVITSDYYPNDFGLIFSKSTCLMTTDLKAVNYVLYNSYDYQKPVIRYGLCELFGSGAFCQYFTVPHLFQVESLESGWNPGTW